MTYFSEQQRFTQPVIWVLILGLAGVFWYGAFHQLFRGEAWGAHPANDVVLLASWVAIGLALPVLCAIANLRTEVQEDGIRLRFIPFHLRSRIWTWDRIAEIKAREYSPLREFGGWGIRIGPSGRAYNVSGHQGVELTFVAGHRILIGTRDPDGFMSAVERARGRQT